MPDLLLSIIPAIAIMGFVWCAVNHYGDDFQIHGLPGWLTDTLADIEAAETAIALVDEAQSKAEK